MKERPLSAVGRLALAAALAAAASGARPARASTYTVTNTAELIAAVDDANNTTGPHTINLAPGIYTPGGLTLERATTINGGPEPGSVIDGGGAAVALIFIDCGTNAGPVTVNDLTLRNASAGITSFGCVPLHVNRSTITGMSSTGIYGGGSPTVIVNSTISGNELGIQMDEGQADLTTVHVTIAHNGPMGGVAFSIGEWTAVNTLLADNHHQATAWDCNGYPPGGGTNNLDTSGTCGQFSTQVADAMIGALADNGGATPTVALLAGSPAIDNATSTGCPIPGGCPIGDQRVHPRLAIPDVGAYEYDVVGGNTPVGFNVTVKPVDTTTGTTPVTLVFDNVTSAGVTTLTTSASGPTAPAGFRIGLPPVYFHLGTTATFSGTIHVCIDTAGINLPSHPQLLHFNEASGLWQVVTTTFDPATGVICGNTASLSPFAIMGDVEPPVISAPAALAAEATGPNGAAVSYSVTATDNFDPQPTLACAPSSGSVFPLGTTPVTCTAADASGNQASAGFVVTVVDTTPPALTLPAGVSAVATSSEGATVTYEAGASDLVSGAVAAVCTPPSGSLFPIGSTTVTCTATDAAGNASSGTFAVVVTAGPQDPLAGLVALVQQLVPVPYQGWLLSPIHRAQQYLAAGHTRAACLELGVFAIRAGILGHGPITPANAASLIDAARAAGQAIGCGSCH